MDDTVTGPGRIMVRSNFVRVLDLRNPDPQHHERSELTFNFGHLTSIESGRTMHVVGLYERKGGNVQFAYAMSMEDAELLYQELGLAIKKAKRQIERMKR